MSNERGNEADYRLPRHVIPLRYSIRVAPDFSSYRFEGDVEIELEVSEPTREIVCNAAELEVTSARLSPSRPGAGDSQLDITLDEELERVHFASTAQIDPGRYVLACAFSAPLGEKLRGFYRSSFKDEGGEERVIASTHFEATDARRAFPCFDEPEMKAVFAVTLDVPDGLFAVSNTPEREVTDLGGGVRRVVFDDTIKMSTYLVAYAVGPFEATEARTADNNVPLRVVVPKGKLHLTAFALDAAEHALSWFHEYFAIPYPEKKLDLVAIPDFAMGAMENIGCITFREQDLLCDPEKSSIPELSRIAEVVDHEIAHMWFGDLVTMKWWNGIWLNEAFATYMSLCCLDDFRPEWNRWVTFGTEKDMALRVDGLHATRAIEFPVRAPDEAEGMFDLLTYEKGGSVLRMVEQYLGMERFRAGVRVYLEEHSYANTETTDLWDAIESVSGGEPVRAILDSWIFQGGHPLVTARRESAEVVLDERPFEYLPEEERPPGGPPSAIGHDWLVPVVFESRPGSVQKGILGPAPNGQSRLSFPVGDGLAVVNAGGSGTYRLTYEGDLFEAVLQNLAELRPLERFNLVADSWACTLAQLSAPADFLALVRQLRGEGDPNVWSIVAGAANLLDFVAAGGHEAELAAFVRAAAGPELDSIGFEVADSDSPERQRTRAILIQLLGTIGEDEQVRERAREIFRASVADASKAVPASIAESVLEVVVSSGGREEFEEVKKGFLDPSDPLSEFRHLRALTRVEDEELLGEVLELAVTKVRNQDVHIMLRYMLHNRVASPKTWGFVKEHYDELAERLPSHAMFTILGGVVDLIQLDDEGKPAFLDDVRSFVATKDFGGRKRLVDQALERQAINARFVVGTRPTIGDLLSKA